MIPSKIILSLSQVYR